MAIFGQLRENRQAAVAEVMALSSRLLDGGASGLPVSMSHTLIERECIRIQQERITLWRSGGLQANVAEIPRHSTENGWSYDRAA
jgi:hypothetical protein